MFSTACVFRLLVLVAALFAISVAPGPARAEDDLRRVFDEILKNPNDAELNFRYADLAIEKGQIRKALAAYERVLMQDPNNEQAKLGVLRIKRMLEPDFTEWTVVLGGAYESNPRYAKRTTSDTDDGVLSGNVRLRDDRRIGELRWRSDGNLFANWHPSIRNLDFSYLGGSTGPVLPILDEWRLRPAVGGAVSSLDGEFFLAEGSFQLGLEADHAGAFKRLDIKAAYNEIGQEFSNKEGYYVEVAPRLVFPNTFIDGDALILRPKYRFNDSLGDGDNQRLVFGDTFPLRYHQYGAGVDLFVPIWTDFVAGVTFDGNYRAHLGNVPQEDKNRHDYFISPGAQLIFKRVLLYQHNLALNYEWEHQVSNFGDRNYDNHIVGLKSVWQFR